MPTPELDYVSTIKYSEGSSKEAPFILEESESLSETVERPTRDESDQSVNIGTTEGPTLPSSSSSEEPTSPSTSAPSSSSSEVEAVQPATADKDVLYEEELFEFGYAVKDDAHGDDFAHQVTNDGVNTKAGVNILPKTWW